MPIMKQGHVVRRAPEWFVIWTLFLLGLWLAAWFLSNLLWFSLFR